MVPLKPFTRFHPIHLLLLVLVVTGLSSLAPRAESEEAKPTAEALSSDQEKALESLIDNLKSLRATPDNVPKILELLEQDAANLQTEVQSSTKKVDELKGEIASLEEKREALKRRLEALKAAQALLEGFDADKAAAVVPPAAPAEAAQPEQAAAPDPDPAVPAPAVPEGIFASQVLPFFQTNCVGCHGPEKQKGGLRLDSFAEVMKGSEYGAIVVAEKPDESSLVRSLRYQGDIKMPPDGKLGDDLFACVVTWIEQGAKEADGAAEAAAPAAEPAAAEAPAPAAPDAAEAQLARGNELFRTAIHPTIQNNCIGCHGPDKQQSGLRLDSREALLKGSEFGPVVIPGEPEKSALVHALRHQGDIKMPPKEKLPDDCVNMFIEWISLGAPWPEDTPAPAAETKTSDAEEAGLLKEAPWSFSPLGNTDVVGLMAGAEKPTWLNNPIDAFILKELAKAGLDPSPPADRRTLIRRVSLDLTGLPPTPEEVEAFVNDPNPQAYQTLVNRLLASPRYGERWGRHWLDVVRFAETNGFETNTPRRTAWHYRDYVIEAFNQDKPFNRFILEQIAGDALGEDRATGLLVGGPMDEVKSPDPVLTQQQRMNELDDMIGATTTAFLGLTVACARCHDHKFDPITQVDYYRLQAVFSGVRHGERDLAPVNIEHRAQLAGKLREGLGPILTELAQFEPRGDPDLLFIDDESRNHKHFHAPLVSPLVPPSPDVKTYADGTQRGQSRDPGTETRSPNLGWSYTHWSEGGIAGKDLMEWTPARTGRHRIWLSWGAGWLTRAQDARYFLDRDGKDSTRKDRIQIAQVDQRDFSDAKVEQPGQALWSGFYDAGVHELTPESRIILTAGSTDASVSADLVALQMVDDASSQLAYRTRINPVLNEERFEPTIVAAIRFTVIGTDGNEPCIDEIEVYGEDRPEMNVALASGGSKASASSLLPGYEIHQIEHINDGQTGNDRSWISNEAGGGSITIEFPDPVSVSKVSWGRDRSGKVRDRVVTRYTIEGRAADGKWVLLTSGDDHLPYVPGAPTDSVYRAGSDDKKTKTFLSQLVTQEKTLRQKIRELEEVPRAYAGTFIAPPSTHLLHRGDPMMKRELVEPGVVKAVGLRFTLPDPSQEQNRRLALAAWIADEDNPLTARVMANRVWHYHFGRGLVTTPSEFGNLGAKPSHPELLDWLAKSFVESGWRVKSLHRLILLSNTYQQASFPRDEALAIDADSKLLWRYPPHRLEAEPIRDSILFVSGKLDLTVGGPGYEAFEPDNSYVHIYIPKQTFGPEDWRRMVYQFKPRMEQDITFGVFDCPDAALPTPKRMRSTTPLQALNLLNSPFLTQQADLFAERVRKEAENSPTGQVTRAFRLVYGRLPDAAEAESATNLVEQHGLTALCRALYNSNEFLYVN